MRLWLPQLYAIVGNYDDHLDSSDNDAPNNLCEMIAQSVNQSDSMLTDELADCTDSVRIKPYKFHPISIIILTSFTDC